MLAYYYSIGGKDVGRLNVMDIESGEIIDTMEGSISNVLFLEGGRYYYVRLYRSGKCPDGVSAPCARVFLRDSGKDEMVFGYGVGTSNFITLKSSSDRSKALINVTYGWRSSTLYLGDLMRPNTWVRIYGGDHMYHPIDYIDGCLAVRAYDRGGMGRIICVREDVREVVPESREYMDSAATLGDKIASIYRLRLLL
jgi:prolyl oligopeptidase PreP (S9A serine peptidase family)